MTISFIAPKKIQHENFWFTDSCHKINAYVIKSNCYIIYTGEWKSVWVDLITDAHMLSLKIIQFIECFCVHSNTKNGKSILIAMVSMLLQSKLQIVPLSWFKEECVQQFHCIQIHTFTFRKFSQIISNTCSVDNFWYVGFTFIILNWFQPMKMIESKIK